MDYLLNKEAGAFFITLSLSLLADIYFNRSEGEKNVLFPHIARSVASVSIGCAPRATQKRDWLRRAAALFFQVFNNVIFV
jgi:hypothetical protein